MSEVYVDDAIGRPSRSHNERMRDQSENGKEKEQERS